MSMQKIVEKFDSQGKVSSFRVLENRALRKFIINSPEFEKLRFFVGGALLLCLTSMQKIVKKFEVKDVEMGIYVCRENCTRFGGKFKLNRGVIRIIRDFPDHFLVLWGMSMPKIVEKFDS